MVNDLFLNELNDASVNYLALNTEIQTEGRQIGSQYPLFKFSTNTMFNFEIHELSITSTKFNYLSASPVDRAYIFDFSFSGTDYQVPDFKMYSSNF